jgi:hypothetical protein
MSSPQIRDATRDDIPTILYFVRNISTFVLIQIQQLAIYEKALDQVEATEDSVGTGAFLISSFPKTFLKKTTPMCS